MSLEEEVMSLLKTTKTSTSKTGMTKSSRVLLLLLLEILIFISGECNSLSLPSRFPHHHLHEGPQHLLLTPSEQQTYKFQVLENSKAGIVVGQVSVRNNFEYQFIPEVKEFSLDSSTGVIKTSNYATDRESQEYFHLVILASSSLEDANYSLTVDIHVLDVNDCRPSLTAVNNQLLSSLRDDLDMRIPSQKISSLTDDRFVMGFKVSDCDSGLNSRVTFSLSSDDQDLFNLDPQTGVVKMTTIPSLDNNITSSLQIIVKDNSQTEALSSSLFIRVAIISGLYSEISDQLVHVPSLAKHVSELAKVNSIVHEFLPIEREGDFLQMLVLGGDPYSKFRFEGNILLVNDHLDYEDVSSYELFIEVTRRRSTSFFRDSERSSSFQMIKLKVIIENENDNYPQFESDSYSASVPEEVSESVMVVQVVAHDRDLIREEELEFLRFSINTQKDPTTTLPFKIDSSGRIWTTGKLDRENKPSYDLEVIVEDDQGLSSTCKVHVSVEDKNDNPPRFTRLFSTEISESAPKGSFVIQVTSSDKDSDASFTEASYSLLDDSNMFEIDSRSGKIFLIGTLDRESRDEYLLQVSANDSSWRAQTTVTVIVLDENDNPPIFERSSYEFKKIIGGSLEPESRVGRVIASDFDAGDNREITYSLKEYSSLWAINPSTGQISMKVETIPAGIFHLIVIASDQGTPSLTNEASVTISVLTSESVEGTSSLQTQDIKIPLPLDLKNGSVIHTLKTQDGVSLQASSPETNVNLLRVIGNRILFLSSSSLRVGSRHLFAVKSSSENFNLSLVIVRPNLHAPMFSQRKFQIIVPENKNVSELVAPFQATDADVDEANRNIVYSYKVTSVVWNERAVEYFERTFNSRFMTPSSKTNEDINEYFVKKDIFPSITNPFKLDSESGTLSLRTSLDFEMIVSYRLEISAKDGAFFGSKNSSTQVIVHVSDINDNRPLFVSNQELEQGIDVYENNLIGQIVGDVRAVDYDSLPNAQITFEIEPMFDYHNFSISAKTGQIQALGSFDFEKKNEYQVSIIAKNDNTLKTSSLLKIRVRDVGEIHESSQDGLSFGMILTLAFFIILFAIIGLTYIAFHQQKMKEKEGDDNNSHGPIYGSGSTMSMPRKMPTNSLPTLKEPTLNAMSLMPTPSHLAFNGIHHNPVQKMMYTQRLSHPHIPPHHVHHVTQNHSQSLQDPRGNQYSVTTGCPTPSSPDILDGRGGASAGPSGAQVIQRMIPAPPSSTSFSDGMRPSCDNYSEILAGGNEQYDLENASSIAPSDIDLAFMYKGYPPPLPPVHPHTLIKSSSSGQPSNQSEQQRNPPPVPMSRMSPSVSEFNGNPRILTLQNLSPSSGQPGIPSQHHHPGQRKMICQRRPETMTTVMSSDDDDGNNTVDSFTSSEYEEQQGFKQHQPNPMGFNNRVW
jgi:hypothetical protein